VKSAERSCMTSTSTPGGVLVLDAVVFIGGVLILGVVIAYFARRIFKGD